MDGVKRRRVLEKPEGYRRSDATAVNNQGVVVGWVDGHRGSKIGPVPFVCENGRLRVFAEGGPAFSMAMAINDKVQMRGHRHRGAKKAGGASRG